MGCAVARAAASAGHHVTVLLGPVPQSTVESAGGKNIEVVRFVTFDELKGALEERFDACDALIMAAAVGDFKPEKTYPSKLPRRDGPVALKLIPTEDILAGMGRRKRTEQIVIAFAVEDASAEQIQTKARQEMAEKNADYVVVNTPAAIDATDSYACILSRDGIVCDWSTRPKDHLAGEIVKLLKK